MGTPLEDRRHATRLALAGYACLFASAFADNARSPVLPALVDTRLASARSASLLFAAGSAAGLPGSLIAGALIARVGPRATLRLMAVVLAAGVLLVAAAGASGHFFLVPPGSLVLGCGLAGVGVLANYYGARAHPGVSRPRGMARLHITYALASLGVPLILSPAMTQWPWYVVFATVAFVPMALLPLSVGVPFVAPHGPLERKHAAGGGGAITAVHAAAISCFVVAEVSVSAWILLFAERTTTYGPETRALLLAGFFVGMATARFLGGILLRAHDVRPAIALAAIATIVVALLGLHVHPALLSLVGLTSGILFPTTISALCHELPQGPEGLAQQGMAIGIVAGAYSAVLAVAHLAIGGLVDVAGVDLALHVGPACELLGIVLLGSWWWKRNRAGPSPTTVAPGA